LTAAAVDEHARLILAALAAGPAGKTEIAARIGSMSDQQVIRRMKRLERLGRVVRTGGEVLSAAGRAETEWRVA
jgi:DNA-binding HxlR family transcriptional regulator